MSDERRPEGQPPAPDAKPDDLGFELPAPATMTATRGIAIALVVAVVLVAAFVVGIVPKRRAAHEREERVAEGSRVRVVVVTPRAASTERRLTLPGNVRPLEETVITSRATGYLRAWRVDLGARVTEGQELAVIDTPEVDQELLAARAQLAQAEASVLAATANRDYAALELQRSEQMRQGGFNAQQDLDQRRATSASSTASVAVARAAVQAQRANVQRLVQMKSFARVTAPFAGIIAARMVDRGALVSATAATPLFRLVATDPVRVFVQVSQDLAPSVRAGLTARVSIREYPGRVFEGRVEHAAGALDAATRTMNTEVRVANADGAILAGMYAEVALVLPVTHRVMEVPATAVISDGSGVRVATVTTAGTIHLVPVVIERDTGPVVQLARGLNGDERVVQLGSVDLVEGRAVEAVQAAPAQTAPGRGS